MATPYEQAEAASKQVDPLRKRLNDLRLNIEQKIKTLVREKGEDRTVNFEGGEQFEIEGRDDLVVGVQEVGDESTDGAVSSIHIITLYDNEETDNDAGDMSTEDLMNVYEALRDR